MIYIIISTVLVFSLILYSYINIATSGNREPEAVIIEYQGKIFEKIGLPKNNKSLKFTGLFGELIIDVDGYKVRINPFSQHYCPDKICMNTGWINKPPQTIICLPNRLVIYLQGKSQFDGLTH